MELIEKPISSKQVFSFDCFKVNKDTVILPNGTNKDRTFIKHPGGVCILAVNEANEIAFVKQYRYPIKKVLLELPAGKLDKVYKESTLDGAKRELEEEIGFKSNNMEKLGVIYPSAAIVDETLTVFFAKDLKIGKKNPDDDEFIDVEWLNYNQILEKIETGELSDSKSISSIMIAKVKQYL